MWVPVSDDAPRRCRHAREGDPGGGRPPRGRGRCGPAGEGAAWPSSQTCVSLRGCRAHRVLGGMAVVAALAAAPAAPAVDRVELSLGRLDGAGWRAEGVVMGLGLGEGGLSLDLDVPVLVLPPPLHSVTGLRLRCPTLTVRGAAYRCDGGTAEVRGAPLDHADVPVDLLYDPAAGAFEGRVLQARLAGGTLSLTGRSQGAAWKVSGEADRIALAEWVRRLSPTNALPAGWRVAGEGRVRFSAAGGPALAALEIEGSVSETSFADATGRHEGQGLAGTWSVSARRREAAWAVETAVRLGRGALYLDPVYLEVPREPLEIDAAGTWDPVSSLLGLERLRYRHAGVLDLEGGVRVQLGPPVAVLGGRVARLDARLGPLYRGYLQPWLSGTALDRLDVTGAVTAAGRWSGAAPAELHLDLDGAAAVDGEGRFGVRGLSGTLRWREDGPGEGSALRWEGGNLLRIPFGAGLLEATAVGGEVRLTRPLELPVLGGAALIDRLEAQGIGSAAPEVSIEGLLTPVSMEALTEALGWPTMGGALSGVVPALRYREGRMTVEGALLLRVFDGEVVVRDLVLERPLGVVPRLSADVDVRALDLEALTRAFSFGTITGRLGGAVRGLRLERWEPVAFDARLETPPDDRSRHRISQRAVESLASLGGASGVLSRTFLGLFQEFSYDRLGIACRLRDGVCEMDGVAPAEGGYAIVQGGGIPRIDVVGYNRRVDWGTLVERLRSATRGGTPRVE